MHRVKKTSIAAELLRRKGIVDACFSKQREPVDGCLVRGERQVGIITSRRGGKTHSALRTIARDAEENPKSKYAYIGLSRVTAENIAWKELERIDDEHGINLDMQGYRLRAIFPNKADLTLYGADQPGWLKKFKGAKYRGVIIDEAGEFDIDLHDFIFRVIKPCLSDERGFLMLMGTPAIVPSGYWWAITRPDEEKRAKGWNVYNWHTFDNPFMKEQFTEDMEQLREMFGEGLEELPWFRREWLGEWCTDTSNNVYRYDPDRNNVNEWTPEVDDTYTLAIDLGYADATAFVIGVYNERVSDKLTFIDCYHKTEMSLDEIAEKVKEYQAKYHKLRIIADPDSKNTIATLCGVYGLPIGDAKKSKKQDNVGYMNNSLLTGKVNFLMPQCLPYGKEILELKKRFLKSDERTEDGVTLGEWKEHPKQPNDMCDCGLYIHREALHYLHTEPKPKVPHGSAEYYENLERKLQDQATSRDGDDELWLPQY